MTFLFRFNKKILVLAICSFLFLVISFSKAEASTYYISSSGSDSNNGTSSSTPWQTLSKVNSTTFQPGDNILFKKGDTFYGSITVNNSGTAGNPITFSSYGTGEKPIITGFTNVTSWTNLGNNIWESTNAVSTLDYLNIVLVDSTNTPMGRTPNGLNYYTYQSHDNNLSITSSDLTGTPNWTGAMAIIRKNSWTWQQSTITSQSGGTINYTDIGTSYTPNNNYNFFIQNDIRTLDTQNEWYYNPATKKLSIYSISQPVNVKVPTIDKTMTGSSCHYVTLNGLTFDGANSSGVFIDNSSYIDIINSNFNNTGQFGVYFYATQYNTVDSSTFNNNNWSALTSSTNSNYITYTNNIIENTFLIQGVGTGSIASIQAGADNILIQNNIINNSGYNGIMVTSDHGLVKNNFINNSLLRSSDGGGVYTAGANIDLVIESNIFANGYGFPVGVGEILGVPSGATGIYLDINASNTTIKNNTVLNNKTGIYLNQGTDNNTIIGNLTYNNKFEFLMNNNNTSPDLEGSIFNNVVTDNIFVSKEPKLSPWWNTNLNVFLSSPWGNVDILKFINNSDRNYYVTPSSDLSMFEAYQRNVPLETFYTLDQWRTFTGHDANSKYVTFLNTSDIFFDYNATTSSKTVSLPWPAVDLDGTKVTGDVTIPSYGSVIYLKDPNPVTGPKTYYISSSGNDSNNGTSSSAPWQTLAKVNATTFQPGDNILFKKGDTFYGTITINNSGTVDNPITFSSYGTGEKPIITGFTTISGWTDEGGGIYSKIITSESQTNMVTIDGVNTGIGRTPNSGTWNIYESFSSNVSITDNQLTGTPNWTGAEVVIKKNDWTIERRPITNHTGTTINYSGGGPSASNSFGYFFQNSLQTLDQFGEWYHDTTSGKFYMYFGAVNPITKTVKVATKKNLFGYTDNLKNYITIDGLTFLGSIDTAIKAYGITSNQWASHTGWTVKNSTISHSGGQAIYFLGEYDVIDNNNIDNIIRTGITLFGGHGTVTGNTMINIGMIEGQSFGGYTGINVIGGNTLDDDFTIQYNILTNIGYDGIYPINANGVLIKNNFIDNAVAVLNDGGGIYQYGVHTGVVITENIIINTFGNSNGCRWPDPLGEGIYLDEGSGGIVVLGNSIYNSAYSGIKLHKSNSNTISNNLIFNNNFSGIFILNQVEGAVNAITGNKFIAKLSTQSALRIVHSTLNTISTQLTSDNNIYARPVNDTDVFYTSQPSTGIVQQTLPQWQSFSGQDLNSKSSPVAISSESDIFFDYNATTSSKTVSLPWPAVDLDGTKVTGDVTIPSYGSVIYLKDPNPTVLDTTAPTITAFTLLSTASSLTVPISSLAATDATGVTGYLVKESATTPASNDSGWSSSAPTSYIFSTSGSKTLYAWAKDAAGNISNSSSANVTITIASSSGGGSSGGSSGGGSYSSSGGGGSSSIGSSSAVITTVPTTTTLNASIPTTTTTVSTYTFTLPMRLGSKGPEVLQLQKTLNSLGYNSGIPDGSFGLKTQLAVKKFQLDNSSVSDGIVGPGTRALLNKQKISSIVNTAVPTLVTPVVTTSTDILTKTSRLGSKLNDSEEVKKLQRKLISKGYNISIVDGKFGKQTFAAVVELQKDNGLVVDGVAGSQVRELLNK